MLRTSALARQQQPDAAAPFFRLFWLWSGSLCGAPSFGFKKTEDLLEPR
jgi:hypothetical protein